MPRLHRPPPLFPCCVLVLAAAALVLGGCPQKKPTTTTTTVRPRPRVVPAAERLRITQKRTLEVRDQLILFRLKPGNPYWSSAAGCPPSLAEVASGRFDAKLLKDGWDQPLKHRCGPREICVLSRGPNQLDDDGQGDDIKVCYSEAPLPAPPR